MDDDNNAPPGSTTEVSLVSLSEDDLELVDEAPAPTHTAFAERRDQLAAGRIASPPRPESPTVLERALVEQLTVDDSVRATRLERELDAAASDPAASAVLAYELGELYRRGLRHDDRALAAYRRAFMLDPTLRANAWALRRLLYRRELWPELGKLIDTELQRPIVDIQRVELLHERAAVWIAAGAEDRARIALDAAARIAPRNQAVLLELERVLARGGDVAALATLSERLAEAIEQPGRKIAQWLDVARLTAARDRDRANRALDAADRLARGRGPGHAKWIARTRVAIADAHGTPREREAALEALAVALQAMPAHTRAPNELAALRTRQAQLARATGPLHTWQRLQQALELAPEEPLVLADLIELTSELGRADEVARLIEIWARVESDAGRAQMVSWWCAAPQLTPELRDAYRPLLTALHAIAPGSLQLMIAVERDVIVDPARAGAARELAEAYVASARAAIAGTWLPAGVAPTADPEAAAALYVQAAHLFTFHVATPAAFDRAREALGDALVASANAEVVGDAWLELDDATARVPEAMARLRERGPLDRATAERAIRLAITHGRNDIVHELERELLEREPTDFPLAWRLDATLFELGLVAERANLAAALADSEIDPARRRTALLDAARARAHGHADNLPAATELFRRLLAQWPTDRFARDGLIECLRAQQQWLELTTERRVEAAMTSDIATVRRALREAAWVLEVRLDDLAGAAALYDGWLSRLPDDRSALEGVARCRAALADPGEVAVRALIAKLDDNPESAWLHARSLERTGRYDDAAVRYRRLAVDREASVLTASAALAVAELATHSGDAARQVEAFDALARVTTDTRLAAALLETSGWISACAIDQPDAALQSFAAALALEPSRAGALLGTALLAADRTEPLELAKAYAALATVVKMPEVAAALHLRAAALAAAAGQPELGDTYADGARAADPTNLHAQLVALELEPMQPVDTTDPFGTIDRLLARAELVARRAALVDDPHARMTWELDRAELLESANELRDASAAVASALHTDPEDWRALVALRRLSMRMDNRPLRAQASATLARHSRDREFQLRMLRDALEVYDQPGPGNSAAAALAICERIAELDAGAPEGTRLLALLRARGNAGDQIRALTARLTALAASERDAEQLIALLLERAILLRARDRRDAAIVDADAVLAYSRVHPEAIALRAQLAAEAGDTERAIAMSQRYLALDLPGPRRDEIERLLTKLTPDDGEGTDGPTDPTITALRDGTRPEGVPLEVFGGATTPIDTGDLQAEEHRIARERESAEMTSVRARGRTPRRYDGSETTDTSPHKFELPELDLAQLGFERTLPPARSVTEPFDLDAVSQAEPIEPLDDDAVLDDSAVVMMSFAKLQAGPSNSEASGALLQCERELAAVPEDQHHERQLIALHLEAGRLAESVGEPDRAQPHYEAALIADPRATPALRGLRRIARAHGDLPEVARLVETELAFAAPRERGPLLRYRVDLLMATGERDLARVAVGELLDSAPLDAAALLAQFELAFLDGRTDETSRALEQLATVIRDPDMRVAALVIHAALVTGPGHGNAAAGMWATAAAIEPHTATTRVAAVLRAVLLGERDLAGAALFDLACQVEGEDPLIAAALAARALTWLGARPTSAAAADAAAQLAVRAAPRDPLVARLVAETALASRDNALASHALARWARGKSTPAERAYAAARVAELEPAQFGRLWAQVLELDPDDDYAAAQLRAAHLAAGDLAQAADLDLAIADAHDRVIPLLRTAAQLVDRGQFDPAIDALVRGRTRDPQSAPIAVALADAYAGAGRWRDRAALYGELADHPMLSASIVRLRAAFAWDRAARDASMSELRDVAQTALDAWEAVLQDDPRAARAHAAAIMLASRLDDSMILAETLARAQAAERSPWAAASLALRRARLLSTVDPRLAQDVAQDAALSTTGGSPPIDDPRTTLEVMLTSARCGQLGDAATALEERATALTARGSSSHEPATLRLRAAELALVADDVPRAAALLAQVDAALPGTVDDLIDIAELRADQPLPVRPRAVFTRTLRDAELAYARDDAPRAIIAYQRALELRPGDAFAAVPLVRVATALRDPVALAAVAAEQLLTAEATGDASLIADAHELVAYGAQLRGEPAAAEAALERAFDVDSGRFDLAQQLERSLATRGRADALLALRTRQLALLDHAEATGGAPSLHDRRALTIDAAKLATRVQRADPELLAWYRAALDADGSSRLAMIHLDQLLVRAAPGEEHAALYEHIAAWSDDPRSQAALLTRAGQTLAVLGRPEEAVQRFAAATERAPIYAPALEIWRETALANQLWLSLADAVTRRASLAGDPDTAAALHHFAAVVLMDKAHAGELAAAALHRAVAARPDHPDALVRLQQLAAAPPRG